MGPRARGEREHLHAARPGGRARSSTTATCSGWAAGRTGAERRAALPAAAPTRSRRCARRSTASCAPRDARLARGRSARTRLRTISSTGYSHWGSSTTSRRRSPSGWCSPSRLPKARSASRFGGRRAPRSILPPTRSPRSRSAARSRRSRDRATRIPNNVVYVAYVDGEPVARACGSFAEHGVTLFGGSTLPEARGRGAYRALVAARWEDAVARGTPVLVTQAIADVAPDSRAARLPGGVRDPDPARRVRSLEA